MGNYKLSKDAQADLIRIHQHGVRVHGEAQADEYYFAFFTRFEQISEQPFLYQGCDNIRKGYRQSICGVDTIYYRVKGDTVEIMNILGRQNRGEWL